MNTVKVNITGESLTYEGETSITKAAQVIAFLNAEERSTEATPMQLERAPEHYSLVEQPPKVSPRQMLITSGAKTNAERIAAFVYLLKHHQAKSSAAMQDVKMLFARAGEPVPQNFARDLKDAVRTNYVFESEGGEYELTEFGEEAVEKKFALDKVNKTERKRAKPKTAEVREDVVSLDIGAAEDGFPPFHSLNKGQQILWICVVADSKGTPELNYKEIVQLIDRLKGNVTTGTFTALNESNVKKGYLKPMPSGSFKVTQPGIDRIKELAQ